MLSYFEKRAILSEDRSIGSREFLGGEKVVVFGPKKPVELRKKNRGPLLSYKYTACLIGILMYCNPYTTGKYNPLYTLNNQGFFLIAVSTVG